MIEEDTLWKEKQKKENVDVYLDSETTEHVETSTPTTTTEVKTTTPSKPNENGQKSMILEDKLPGLPNGDFRDFANLNDFWTA